MQTIRYQVFVSSTFTDLKEERAEVIQALWEMDCIPTGMEAFVASNESQWKVIERVIDDSDYYVLIVGGRYGSVTEDGISYTEKEYRYAKQLGIPVLAFVHADPDKILAGKSEKDALLRQKLETFRASVMQDYPIRRWSSPAELGGIVSRSLLREIRISPRPGWVRNDGSSHVALLEQVNALSAENLKLRESLAIQVTPVDDDKLAHGVDIIGIQGTRQVGNKGDFLSLRRSSWGVKVAWDELFSEIGPLIMNEASEDSMRKAICLLSFKDPVAQDKTVQSVTLSSSSWNQIIIQFRALGFIQPGVKKRVASDKESYWAITKKGDNHLLSLMAIKTS